MLFLGLDCSTQSLSAVAIDFEKKEILYEKSLNFERDFPEYHTVSGTVRHPNPLIVHSPPLMWVEALDRLFAEMKADGVDFRRIEAISGSAQQHGSVYLNDRFPDRMAHLEIGKSLKENFSDVFSRVSSPIWMDSSTAFECGEIRKSVGGALSMIEASGSDAIERFTASQIRKFYKSEPENYSKTSSIALVSSFLASLLSGKIAPIDYGDGSGMNLMDIRKKEWHKTILEATAPDLLKKLPPLSPSCTPLGPIHPYFVKKYGVHPKTLVLNWTGDNPSSSIGLGLIEEGTVGISVGTSFTYFGAKKEFHVDKAGEGNLFVSPTGDFLPLNCFLNGALAIQKMRSLYHLEWEDFIRALETTPMGKGLLLPYFDAEIIPKVLQPGIRRFDLEKDDAGANCRALIEGQMMSMRLHSKWMKMSPKIIYATGGVSNHLPILQIMADVHQCPVIRSSVAKSTALGAALCAAFPHSLDWKETIRDFTKPIPPQIEPNPKAAKAYDSLIRKYEDFEKKSH